LDREELQFAARLDRSRRQAEAERDAILAILTAEERKSEGVRHRELTRWVTEKFAEALKGLPLHEARWITVGPDSPRGSLAGMSAAAREIATPRASGANAPSPPT